MFRTIDNMKKNIDNMKKIGSKGYVYDFSVDYNAIAVADILDIHKHLMKKWDSIKCLDLQSKYFFEQ